MAGIRLGLECNRPDWERMLDELTPQQFVTLRAYQEYLGADESQRNAATVASAVVNEVRLLRQRVEEFMGCKNHDDPTKPDDYIRRVRAKSEAKPKRKHLSEAEAEAQARARIGV